MEGCIREGGLKAKVSFALGLDFVTIVEVNSTSTKEDACEVTGRVPVVEDAALKTSTPTISGGSFLMPGGSEDTSGGASSSTGVAEATARVADQLRD